MKNDALINSKEELFEQLNEELAKIGTSMKIIVKCDLNNRVGRRVNHKVVEKFGEETNIE